MIMVWFNQNLTEGLLSEVRTLNIKVACDVPASRAATTSSTMAGALAQRLAASMVVARSMVGTPVVAAAQRGTALLSTSAPGWARWAVAAR